MNIKDESIENSWTAQMCKVNKKIENHIIGDVDKILELSSQARQISVWWFLIFIDHMEALTRSLFLKFLIFRRLIKSQTK
jgi:hypothetical protein